MARTVFFGFGAFVGAIKGPTQIEWWADDPALSGFSASALIPVDLANNPSAARAGTIAIGAIEVDDHRVDGGLTTVGPRFPLGATVGACVAVTVAPATGLPDLSPTNPVMPAETTCAKAAGASASARRRANA
jgi:hypothetical protein